MIQELRLRTYGTLLIAALTLALFTGCGDSSDESSAADSPDATSVSVPETETEEADDTSEAAATEDDFEDDGTDPEPVDGIESVYTDLDIDNCDELAYFEEGGHVELRCPGYKGIDLFVTEGDLRFDVDVGVPNNIWTSQGPFNYLGNKVEWRLRDGVPFAVIIRYHVSDLEGGEAPSVLAVISVGRDGSPGCLVGWVEADAKPSQNEAARRLADEEGEGFDCGSAG